MNNRKTIILNIISCFFIGYKHNIKLQHTANVILLILFFVCNIFSQNFDIHKENLTFQYLDLEDGLSQNTITSVIQDSLGFIWIGTEDGLNRFDGYEFIVFKYDPDDSNSISNDYITCLYIDRNGTIWIGTEGGGLNRYNQETENFISFKFDESDPQSISSNNVSSIYMDKSGHLWVGTTDGGINKSLLGSQRILNGLGSQKIQFLHYKNDINSDNSLSNNHISQISEDQSGNLWIGTNGGGLEKFDPKREIFTHHKFNPKDPNSIISNQIQSIYIDTNDILWLGTYGEGINWFNPHNGLGARAKFMRLNYNVTDFKNFNSLIVNAIYKDLYGLLWVGTKGEGLFRIILTDRNDSISSAMQFKNDERYQNTISSNEIRTIFEDQAGSIWIGTFAQGLNRIDAVKKKFVHYKTNLNSSNSLSNNTVWAFCEDSSGIIWIGTEEGGLNKFDGKSEMFSYFQDISDGTKDPGNKMIRSIFKDKHGNLWVGTNGAGLYKLLPRGKSGSKPKFINFKTDPHNPQSLSNNFIRTIYEDNFGSLWIGTNGGLNKIIKNSATSSSGGVEEYSFIRFETDLSDSNSLSSNLVRAIHQNKSGTLWIGTRGGGLNILTRDDQNEAIPHFIRYKNNPEDIYSISDNDVLSIHEDINGVIWIGTHGGGLNKIVLPIKENLQGEIRDNGLEKLKFIHYSEKNGLPNNVVYGILEDDNNNLWLSTNNGISRFNPQTESFSNYDVSDGLQSNEFNYNAFFKSSAGEMFFGGINGFNKFYPEEINNNQFIPPVVFKDFQIFNKSVPIGSYKDGAKSPLQKSISVTDKIELSYKENIFSFEIAALNFINPEKNQYKYFINGFSNEWIDLGTRHSETIMNLNPGKYTLIVKGSNNDGVWNELGASIEIYIIPPFWQTWWFRLLSFLVIISLLFMFYRYRINKIEEKKQLLEVQIKEKTEAAQKIQDALSEVEILKNQLQAENIYLQDEIKLTHNFENIISTSEELKKILYKVEQVASTDTTVLVLGESGTGKELVARAVHSLSSRKNKPLIKINCATLPANLIESELFGHEKGAFTGAFLRKIGRFEVADQWELIFLDEMGSNYL